MLLLINIIRRK